MLTRIDAIGIVTENVIIKIVTEIEIAIETVIVIEKEPEVVVAIRNAKEIEKNAPNLEV